MLQFITDSPTCDGTVKQVVAAVDGGCRWIQIRMKDIDIDVVSKVLDEITPLCMKKQVTLIVDDHVELAKRADVNGVHLGQSDMPTEMARQILGPDKIIGLTINTEEQARMAKDSSADYYGVGPWRFTNTKKKLATILGRAGVQHLVEILKKDRPDREIVAIGGIGFEDIKDVMLTGADGIAVSGLITKSENPALTTQRIIEEIYKQKRNI